MKIYKLDEFSDMIKRKGGSGGDKSDKRSKLERIKDKELGILAATVLCLKRGCSANGPEVVIGSTVFRLCENRQPCENRQMNLLDLTKGKEKGHRGKSKVTLTTKGGNSSVDAKKTEKRQTRKAPKGKNKESKSNGGISILSFAGDGATAQKGGIQIVQKKVDTLTQKTVVEGVRNKPKELIKSPVEGKKGGEAVKEKSRKEKESAGGESVVEGEKGRVSLASQEADQSKTIAIRDEPTVEPISPRQLIEPTEKALGIDESTAERILTTALGYLTKYPSVGTLRFIDDISKLSKMTPDLVKKLLTVLRSYDIVEVHEMGVVNLIRPTIIETKTNI